MAKTIYLVDDDEDDRLILSEAIRAVDRQVEIVESVNGFELLQRLDTGQQPVRGLIVVDMNMPKLNGLETILELKTRPVWQDFPILLISTASKKDILLFHSEIGEVHFHQKPSCFHQYISLAEKFLTVFDQ